MLVSIVRAVGNGSNRRGLSDSKGGTDTCGRKSNRNSRGRLLKKRTRGDKLVVVVDVVVVVEIFQKSNNEQGLEDIEELV